MDTVRATGNISPQPIMIDELLARCVGRLDLLEKVLANFEELLPSQVSQLEQAVHSGDLAKTRSLAHQLKGASLTVAAHGLSGCAQRLEASAAVEQSPQALELCLEEMRQECERLLAAVRVQLSRN